MKEELMAQAVTALVSLFVSSGITGIVYNVMKTQITSLKEELERNREDFNSRIKQLEENNFAKDVTQKIKMEYEQIL